MAPLIGPDRRDPSSLVASFYGVFVCPQRSAKLPQAQQALKPGTRSDERVRPLAVIQAGEGARGAAQARDLPRQRSHQVRKHAVLLLAMMCRQLGLGAAASADQQMIVRVRPLDVRVQPRGWLT